VEQTVTHSTFTLERAYSASPERVFAAFSDPTLKKRWYVDNKPMTVEEFQMDFRVGGSDLARFRFGAGSPFPGMPLTYYTSYQDIVPNRRIVYAYSMDLGDKRVSSSLTTFEFLPDGDGTQLIFTEQGAFYEGADGPQMRQAGWNTLLDHLGRSFAA